jgi:tetratricopeptide (TPR) repeat protein
MAQVHPTSPHPGRLLPTVSIIFLLAFPGCGWLARNENAEGVKLYQQGNYLGAVNHFQQALAQQPGSPDCFYNLGATYHQQAKVFGRPADMQTAEQYYHLCLSRNPNHEACQRALAVLFVEENRGSEATAQLESWARRQPANPNPQIELARLYQEHGDIRQAENHLVDALAIDPSNPRALVALGQLRELTGDQSQALANYSRALSVDAQQPVVAAKVASLGGATQGTAAQAGGVQVASLPAASLPIQPATVVQPVTVVQAAAQPVVPMPLATGNAAR